MSDNNFFGDGTDFFDDELNEQGVPAKKPGDLPGSEEEAEEAGHVYPTPKPRTPVVDEKDIPRTLYDKSPEIFKDEKKETLLDPDKDHEFAREQYPNSPQLAGEKEVLRNFITVPHKISGEAVLAQQGYRSLKETVQNCQPCRQLDYARIENEDLSSITIDEVSFKNGLIENTTFQNARIRSGDFSNCELDDVNFDGADLQGSSFKGCDLSSCSFIGANLSRCNFVGTILPPADQMKGAQMAGIKTEEEKPEAQQTLWPG